MPQTDPAAGHPTSERVSSIFTSIADRYDTFNSMASMGIDRGWRRELVRAAHLTPSSRVLDLASGTGDVAFAVANLGHPAEVVATDFNAEMLAVAKAKAEQNPPAVPVSFSIADAQALPFDDATFDVVTVAFGVRNFPDREKNFAEVLRVLKPSGRYIILEFSRPNLAVWRGVYHLYLRHAIPAIGGALTGDRDGFVYLNDSIRQFPAQAELAAELRRSGFTTISWKDMSGGIVALHTAVK
ncbi:MAG: bifunctional demethylmenaquinone methyltransferase/2-methoxy-6-polyprenyl-1,4-benzoquinol methylase UbiE [Coriobacteriia bacterium]|nr:bifunctional demethylmenaquinone methyltransferase/2-methoxy-6-polyprenyl-1,4-benzoquinol methylase UbiE [Coriobacteriia bacterium]